MRAYIIVDLGFGDAGKGLLTDFLARQRKAGLVVRYNGGAQAGHNVVTPEGHHHTFSQFGSGSFLPYVNTYLSRFMVIHPAALLVEGQVLEAKRVRDPFSRLRISDQALVITPFHQAANRIREIARGANRHGSCGVGVGEAVEDARLRPETSVWAGDLARPALLRGKLEIIREQKHKQAESLCSDLPTEASLAREFGIFEKDDVIEHWISSVARIGELGLVVSDSVLEGWLQETESVVFEGAQGVLLDEDAGFHPFTTWSQCTDRNARDLLEQFAPGSPVFRIGVMRSHAVRHGPGPLPTETDSLAPAISEHNRANEWQGKVRYGWFDAVLARYALSVTGGVDALMVTHMDTLAGRREWKFCPAYQGQDSLEGADAIVSDGMVTGFHLSPSLSLAQRAQFTQALAVVQPQIDSCEPQAGKVIQTIESLLAYPVGLVSHGPRAGDVRILNSFPS